MSARLRRRAALPFAVLCLACARPAPPETPRPAPAARAAPDPTEVVLLYLDDAIVRTSHCRATAEVRRSVRGASDDVAAVLTLLFRGTTEAERAAGISSPFERSANDPSARPLREYFIRADREAAVLRLHFREGAMAYLGAAACAQTAVKSSIEGTVGRLGITEVVYVVDGRVVTEWDA